MAVVLYGLGPAQLHGRLVLGCYRQQVSADQSLGSATALSPRTMLSVFDNRYNRHSQAPNHWSGLWRDPCWLRFQIIWNGFKFKFRFKVLYSKMSSWNFTHCPRRVIASFLQHTHIFTQVDPPQHQPMISSTAFLWIESPIFRFLAEILKNSEYNLISNLSRQRDQNVRDYLKIIADAKKMTFLTCDWSYEQALCRDLKIWK